ncbi:hypothetical protein [Desulforhabdus amnigena]|jgi:hypothetical protein|uniref:Lipocalin-like domain-containing protein n=1 Tax=Desulforhabdus amnigena TaxID=40218 RepID=A0A9W6D199_9BACT|nr:hypothetical protein [Desulforhabdus amnigena]NLJ28853.1 hypothetical protein [Deltaproteobacteria bacterium]GLI33129.1 hypothetical protein DAMNIGENAA_05620 [Desulforhabdus amnigena]
MKKNFILITLFVVLAGCATMSASKPHGEPTVFCDVVSPPDPLLLGGWQIVYVRTTETGQSDSNPVKYWLTKHGDKYALYFDRITRGGKKRYLGWKAWTINGNEISSDTGVRIFAEKGNVYYSWKGQEPGKMRRISE